MNACSCQKLAAACIPWPGAVTHDGYARSPRTINGTRYVHVQVYEAAHGPVPAGYQLDHTCHTADDGEAAGRALTADPASFDPRRSTGRTPGGQARALSAPQCVLSGSDQLEVVCSKGHPLVDGNLKFFKRSDGSVGRRCLTCVAQRRRRVA